MQELESVELNQAGRTLNIYADGYNPVTGSCHRYLIRGFDARTNPVYGNDPVDPRFTSEVIFQNGPIAEAGVNGVTPEALFLILQHKYQGFQSGQFACEENERILGCIEECLDQIYSRAHRRQSRHVEGTHEV